jgi:YHS domain-containing protein
VTADDAPGADVKCPVSGKAVDPAATVDFNGGKVYLCCENCPAAFKADPAKYAAKANLQLVQTKQLEQTACPLTGKPTKPNILVDVDGVKVGLCCNNCKGKVDKASTDEKVSLLFGDTSKGFKPAKK